MRRGHDAVLDFGPVTPRERREADLFVAALFGRPSRLGSPTEDAPYDPALKELELKPSSAHGGTPMRERLTRAMLTSILPRLASQPEEVQKRYLRLTNRMFRLFAIDTIESRAFFLAHANVESGEFASMVEADHRVPYGERVRGSDQKEWTPDYVTPGQHAEFKKRKYHKNKNIGPGGNYLYIGRGPLQVTTWQGYKRGREVLDVWGQEHGRNGAIDDASTLLHAAAEIGSDPTLAAIPDYAFLLSGAHFKSARHTSGGGVASMDKSASSAVPLSADRFFAASGSMVGIGSFKELKKYNAADQRLVADNLNRKMVVFRKAIQVLCGSKTDGTCGNPDIGQPPPRITLPLP